MPKTEDETDALPADQAALHEEALRYFGQRFFAEAKNLSAAEQAEFETWKREQREKRSWWTRGGNDSAA